jgi:hypothetical protein
LSVFEAALQRLLDAELALAPPALDKVREAVAPYQMTHTAFDGILGGDLGIPPDEFD